MSEEEGSNESPLTAMELLAVLEKLSLRQPQGWSWKHNLWAVSGRFAEQILLKKGGGRLPVEAIQERWLDVFGQVEETLAGMVARGHVGRATSMAIQLTLVDWLRGGDVGMD